MKRKRASGLMLTLLAISMLTLAFNIQQVEASGTIYIKADGSVEGTTHISTVDNVTYTFTDNIYDEIVVERDNIVVDGAGFTVQGTGNGNGIDISYRSNVTLKNVEVANFSYGIYVYRSSNNTVAGNTVSSNNDCGIYLSSSSNNTLTGNIVSNNEYGIELSHSSNNTLVGNNASNNERGIVLYYVSSNNVLVGNNASNAFYGIYLYSSINNVLTGNNASNANIGIYLEGGHFNNLTDNIASSSAYNNGIYLRYSSNNVLTGNIASSNAYNGIALYESSNNVLFHNNLINNTFQASVTTGYANTWDDGYPSGGNYWSNYNGTDQYTGSGQDQLGSDGIGDTSYIIDAENQDHYPLMSPWTPPEHELVVSIEAPASITLGGSSSLNATVTNQGSSDESNVELLLLINGTTVDSTTVPLLQAGNSHTFSYLWTLTAEGTYNVTAYAHPVPGEASIENNQDTKFVTVAVSAPEIQVGVEAGDWIKCDYTVTGWPSGTPHPEWLKVEILSVEGTTASVRVTMHMSDGTEQSDTINVDVATGSGTFQGLSGFVIPANSKTGDTIYMSGYGNVTLDGETTKTYAGASRTVVYASFSQYGTQLTYYWDKQTGIMVEASTISGDMTATAKATETNMWEASLSPFWMQWWFFAIVAVVIVALVGAVYLLKKRKPPTPTAPLPSETRASNDA